MKKLLLTFALMLTMSVAFVAQTDANPPKSHSVPVTVHKAVTTQRGVTATSHITTASKINTLLRTTPIVHNTPIIRTAPRVVARTTVRVNFRPAPLFVNYNVTHGTRFAQGIYYRGRDHMHWSVQRWDARYRTYLFWDPCVSVWYYWYQPGGCYYPVTYCPDGVYAWGPPQPLAQVPVIPTTDGLPQDGFSQYADSQQSDIPPIPAPIYQ